MPAKIAVTILEWIITVVILMAAEKVVKALWFTSKNIVAQTKLRLASAKA